MRAASACSSFGGTQRSGADQLRQAAEVRRHDRHAGGHRLERRVRRELVVAGRHHDHRGTGQLALHARAILAPDEVHAAADHVRQLHELGSGRALTGHPSGMSASVAALMAVSIPFSEASRDATSAYAPSPALLRSAKASAGR